MAVASWFRSLTITKRLALGFGLVLCLLGGTLIADISASGSQASLANRLITHLFPARIAARDIVTWVRSADDDGAWYVMTPSRTQAAGLMTTYNADTAQVQASLNQAIALADTDSQRAALQDFTTFWSGSNGYLAGNLQAFALKDHGKRDQALSLYVSIPFVPSLNAAQTYINVVEQETATVTQQEQAAANLVRTLSIGLGLLAMLLGIGIAALIARSIAGPLGRLTRAAARLASGDTAVQDLLPPPTGDEVGRLAASFRTMVDYQAAMARVAQGVADGDLAQRVQPQGEADALGHAFSTMVGNLRSLVGQAARSAEEVDAGAAQLSNTTEQLGQASTQIARAIEEVARGASDQSRGAADALASMREFGGVVRQVAEGAGAQAGAMAEAESAIGTLRQSLQQTTERIGAVSAAAERAAGTGREGGQAVNQTLRSIEEVRRAVSESAEQVAALGRSSKEIGAIVAAIDDIAAQTNLLALNAAIEAARAGEHGKGFTVVAAEVRKLAERAGNETKEITARIAAIQGQVAEVVAAMEKGSAAVELSTGLGGQASTALNDILAVVEETNREARAIATTVHEMAASVEAVSGAASHGARISAQTLRAAEQLGQGSDRIVSVIEAIAATSEQSAAGAEEVSASTEEQAAGAQELAAGAQHLAGLAGDLRGVVGQFTLVANDEPARGSDRRPARRVADRDVPGGARRIA